MAPPLLPTKGERPAFRVCSASLPTRVRSRQYPEQIDDFPYLFLVPPLVRAAILAPSLADTLRLSCLLWPPTVITFAVTPRRCAYPQETLFMLLPDTPPRSPGLRLRLGIVARLHAQRPPSRARPSEDAILGSDLAPPTSAGLYEHFDRRRCPHVPPHHLPICIMQPRAIHPPVPLCPLSAHQALASLFRATCTVVCAPRIAASLRDLRTRFPHAIISQWSSPLPPLQLFQRRTRVVSPPLTIPTCGEYGLLCAVSSADAAPTVLARNRANCHWLDAPSALE
ncbi:hypothetical protein B0H13DRAFT_2332419 [Mycena leptocephala]|nr:hypothetical protein B0H13DRAFT_2332419 [Mycena leptocephala]